MKERDESGIPKRSSSLREDIAEFLKEHQPEPRPMRKALTPEDQAELQEIEEQRIALRDQIVAFRGKPKIGG